MQSNGHRIRTDSFSHIVPLDLLDIGSKIVDAYDGLVEKFLPLQRVSNAERL